MQTGKSNLTLSDFRFLNSWDNAVGAWKEWVTIKDIGSSRSRRILRNWINLTIIYHTDAGPGYKGPARVAFGD